MGIETNGWKKLRYDEPMTLPSAQVWPLALAYIARHQEKQTPTLAGALRWACQQLVMLSKHPPEEVVRTTEEGLIVHRGRTMRCAIDTVRTFTVEANGDITLLDIERERKLQS
jgi:hypothetical protein